MRETIEAGRSKERPVSFVVGGCSRPVAVAKCFRHHGAVDYGRVLILAALLLVAACSTEPSDSKVPVPNLYLWLYGADELVSDSINPGQRGGASALRLGEALRVCGVKNFSFGSFGLAGEEVYLPSTGEDARIVGCVKSHVDFGFSANRTLPSEWNRGKRGQEVIPADGD